MKWNTLNLSTIYMTDGSTVQAEVNGISLEDGSGYTLLPTMREIKVRPLSEPYAHCYAEETIVKRNDGSSFGIGLSPSQRLEIYGTIFFHRTGEIYILHDGNAWREMTDSELDKWRKALDADQNDMAQIDREWREYRNEGLGERG